MGDARDKILPAVHQVIQQGGLKDHVGVQPQHMGVILIDCAARDFVPRDVYQSAILDIQVVVDPGPRQMDQQGAQAFHEFRVHVVIGWYADQQFHFFFDNNLHTLVEVLCLSIPRYLFLYRQLSSRLTLFPL